MDRGNTTTEVAVRNGRERRREPARKEKNQTEEEDPSTDARCRLVCPSPLGEGGKRGGKSKKRWDRSYTSPGRPGTGYIWRA